MPDETNEFEPNWVSHPGDTIASAIEERNWKQKELAVRLGISTKHLNQLIKGKVPLTADMARRLSLVIGSTEGFWLRREAHYREQMLKKDSLKFCEEYIDWFDGFPLSELKKAGILPNLKVSGKNKLILIRKLLEYFAIYSPKQWEAQYVQMQERIRDKPRPANYRRTRNGEIDVSAISAWMRLGEVCAERFEKNQLYGTKKVRFSQSKFNKQLQDIRLLTTQESSEFQYLLESKCLDAGVVLALVPSISDARISCSARWRTLSRPIIQLSLNGRSNDKFWLAFFRASAHLLLHSEDKQRIFVDSGHKGEIGAGQESEASLWVENFLIPRRYLSKLIHLQSVTDVKDFATRLEIHPGIVVGILQNRKLISSRAMNDLKVNLTFREFGINH